MIQKLANFKDSMDHFLIAPEVKLSTQDVCFIP